MQSLNRHSSKRTLVAGALWVFLLVVVGAGCASDTALYGSLSEQQANEVMATLLDKGINCTKATGTEGAFSVTVSSADFSTAVDILKQAGLPGDTFQGVGDVFGSSGMVSSPTEERIRFMYALAQDLSETLTQIDGVQSARVHVVLPENDPFRTEVKPSSASVFIKHRYDADLESRIPFIKNLVKDGIEGLQYDNISVALFRSAPPREDLSPTQRTGTFLGFSVPLTSIAGLRGVFVALGIVAVLSAGGCAALAWMHFGRRQPTEAKAA